MSFSVSFSARSISAAREKLRQASGPPAVKALIEKAIDALHPIVPERKPEQSVSYAGSSGGSGEEAKIKANAVRPPELIGVMVEAWGHIADPGDSYTRSSIDRFVVQPLFE